MEKVFSGKVWKLPDDVDTDTIIAGRHGVILDKDTFNKLGYRHH